MVVFCFSNHIESPDGIECHNWLSRLSVMPSIMIEHPTMCHDWISWLDLMNTIPWFVFIGYILWFDLIGSILWSDLISLIYWINLIIMTITVLPFASQWKVTEDAPNHILGNMIGYHQISRRLHNDDISLYFR